MDSEWSVEEWAYSKRSAEGIHKPRSYGVNPKRVRGSQHCYNPGQATPNVITVKGGERRCIHINPYTEGDQPVSRSVFPQIVSSLNHHNPRENDSFLHRYGALPPKSTKTSTPMKKQTKMFRCKPLLHIYQLITEVLHAGYLIPSAPQADAPLVIVFENCMCYL